MNIIFHRQAVKDLERLDVPTKQRIKQGIEGIPNGDIIPLQGCPGLYRLRVGNWRIVFSYPEAETVLIEKITPRGSAYK